MEVSVKAESARLPASRSSFFSRARPVKSMVTKIGGPMKAYSSILGKANGAT
jgi:hypothetical protein